MIEAKEARKLSEQSRQILTSDEYPYMKLENAIKHASSPSEGGRTQVVFEETMFCFFDNPRAVKQNLMKLGYDVDIERFNKVVNGRTYVLNRYYIAW